ncbi:putative metalloprotease CJM1_0395 family protein [Halomonas vilamensis]|uniref:Metalloprotease CJM1_0395 family protein n=1 Tax=Vreelandella vilamensis TaxID=531309 RepID=A0ABU1H6L8_9GAMM|nr:putative metalloprotease CJM1_0395 family protein [Halomonas vilamensis]MDR5899402.1 putative metalloprotease CJM1_0395 family protein [Halomonas vilamensis]
MQISPVSTPSTYWSVTATENARTNATARAGEMTLSQADQRAMPPGSTAYREASQSATATEESANSRRSTERAADGSQEAPGEPRREEEKSESAVSPGPTRPDGTPLDDQEIRQLDQLKRTDQEVRQHERAHEVAGGPYTGSASYEYEAGPDGERYAVAGEVPIDYGPVPGDPQATIDKMQTVISAAMAPAEPSSKDRQVASQARQYMLEAKLEAAMQQSEMNTARAGAESNRDESVDAAGATAQADSAPSTNENAGAIAMMAPDPASAASARGSLAAASVAQPPNAVDPTANPDPAAHAA